MDTPKQVKAIMNDHQRIQTAWGRKSAEGVTAIFEEYAQERYQEAIHLLQQIAEADRHGAFEAIYTHEASQLLTDVQTYLQKSKLLTTTG